MPLSKFFFFNDTATTEIYTLSLHDALPILVAEYIVRLVLATRTPAEFSLPDLTSVIQIGCSPRATLGLVAASRALRSEEHTSELQSRQYLVCRLLLEKKNKHTTYYV